MCKARFRTLSKAGREQFKAIENAGFKVANWEITGGNHIRFEVELPTGKTAKIFAALSPGDGRRGTKNMIARIKRLAAGHPITSR